MGRKSHTWAPLSICLLSLYKVFARDGVLLCHMLHSLDPATIEMKLVNQKPALAQFLCLKNIRYLPSLIASVSDSDPDWIWIQSSQWIRVRILIQEGKNFKSIKK